MRFLPAAIAAVLLSVLASVPAFAAEPTFRTDADPNDKLPWFQLRPGEFPPAESAHAISGELIALDHVNRTGVLRPDRTDAQRRGEWDIPLPFVLLPYGSVGYHGAPAELRDIPIGTHLHGQFYVDEPPPPLPKGVKPAKKDRVALEAAFSRVLRLEDDFTHFARQQRAWRVDAVQLDVGALTVTPVGPDGKPIGPDGRPLPAGAAAPKPIVYQVNPATRVWKGRSIGTLLDVAAGQNVLLNLTVCTLKGPGRVTDVWVDAESRQVSAGHQNEVHRQYQREHGLAGYVVAVDNPQSLVTVVLFAGFDPTLKDDFPVGDAMTAVVAEDSLRTWDQINDRKGGTVTEVKAVPAGPGNSGVQVTFKASMLLEGFRPKRVVRLFSSKWKVDDLPREERLYP